MKSQAVMGILVSSITLFAAQGRADCIDPLMCSSYDFNLPVNINNTSSGPALTVINGWSGFGTVNPQAILHAYSITNSSGLFESSTTESAISLKASATTNPPGVSAIADDLRFNTGGANRAIITSLGKFGIGTTTPAQALDVNGTTKSTSLLLGDGTLALPSYSFSSEATTGFKRTAAGKVTFVTGGVERMHFLNGTLSASSLSNMTSVNNSVINLNTTGSQITRNVADANAVLQVTNLSSTSTGDAIQVRNSTAPMLRVTSAGLVAIGSVTPSYPLDVTGDIRTSTCIRTSAGVSAGTCTSDERIKTDVKPFTLGLAALENIIPKTFKYNGLGEIAKSEKPELGLIAQDVEKSAPELVSTKLVQLNKGDIEKTEIKQVNYSGLIYTVINAVKELGGESVELRTQIEIQNKQIEMMKTQMNEQSKDIEVLKNLLADQQH